MPGFATSPLALTHKTFPWPVGFSNVSLHYIFPMIFHALTETFYPALESENRIEELPDAKADSPSDQTHDAGQNVNAAQEHADDDPEGIDPDFLKSQIRMLDPDDLQYFVKLEALATRAQQSSAAKASSLLLSGRTEPPESHRLFDTASSTRAQSTVHSPIPATLSSSVHTYSLSELNAPPAVSPSIGDTPSPSHISTNSSSTRASSPPTSPASDTTISCFCPDPSSTSQSRIPADNLSPAVTSNVSHNIPATRIMPPRIDDIPPAPTSSLAVDAYLYATYIEYAYPPWRVPDRPPMLKLPSFPTPPTPPSREEWLAQQIPWDQPNWFEEEFKRALPPPSDNPVLPPTSDEVVTKPTRTRKAPVFREPYNLRKRVMVVVPQVESEDEEEEEDDVENEEDGDEEEADDKEEQRKEEADEHKVLPVYNDAASDHHSLSPPMAPMNVDDEDVNGLSDLMDVDIPVDDNMVIDGPTDEFQSVPDHVEEPIYLDDLDDTVPIPAGRTSKGSYRKV